MSDGNGADNGSVPLDGTEYEQGQSVTVLGNTGNLVRSGKTFAGWNTQADGNGTTYTQGQGFTMGTDDVVLHAQWTQIHIAYIYDSADSPVCQAIADVLPGYAITRIAHDSVQVTTASLSPYAMIIVADQNTHGITIRPCPIRLSTPVNPLSPLGQAANYLYFYQNVVRYPACPPAAAATD
ncbi:MAG: hypothetical protein VR64_13185 [Desulfatitalea sp. BRH_c12]|nr:MAG: hypothetical protein VR64_13185 [Desulfatitalea sp. BRH_c12]